MTTWLRGPATCLLDRRSATLVDGVVPHVGHLLSSDEPEAGWRIGPPGDPARDGAIEFGVDADASGDEASGGPPTTARR